MAATRPDWYPDPAGVHELRWHNGAAWTADVSDGGSRYVDPLPSVRPPMVGPDDLSVPSRNRPATAAMVLGICGLATAWLPFVVVVGVVAAILGVVFGAFGRRRAGHTGRGRGQATAGLVTGATGCVVAVVGFFLTAAVVDAIDSYENPRRFDATIDSCTAAGSVHTATGTLVNLDDETSDFTVRVGFARADTDNLQRRATITLDDVAPGERRRFEVQRATSIDEIDCVVVDVKGPQPFGIALD